MVLNEHVIMLNALRITYAANWRVYATHEMGDVCAMIEDDVHTMYNAFVDNGDVGAYIPDCQVMHMNIGSNELPC